MNDDWFQTKWAAVQLHFQKRDPRYSVLRNSKNIVSLKDRRVHVYLDSQSMPTHHPLRNNTDVLRLTHLFQTEASCISASSQWPPCTQSKGRERNKQVIVHIYRQRQQRAIMLWGSEYQNFHRGQNLLTNKVFYAEIENPIGRMYSGCIHSATHG